MPDSSRPAPPFLARLQHQVAGRVRLTLEPPIPPREALITIADAVSAQPEVESVDIRVFTGSIIIRHGGSFDPLAIALKEAVGLMVLPSRMFTPTDPVMDAMQRLSAVDAGLGRLSGERVDMRQLAFVGLVAAGLIQIARGQIVGPAFTLFGQAATLAMTWPARPRQAASPGPSRPVR
jgi:hypothetical protein